MLLVRAVTGLIFLFAVVAAVFFGSAGSVRDGRAWAMLAVFFGCAGAITVWLWFRDKALLERRVKAGPGSEPDPMQNLVQALAGLVFLAAFVLPGLDRRFGWSHVPAAVSLIADAMIAVGFLIVFLTFRANTFTAGTIEVEEGQRVIDSGPYAVVRHPMYSGALILVVGISPGAGLVVGPGRRRPARSRPGVAADPRGSVPDGQPRRLPRLSGPRAIPAGPHRLVAAGRCGQRPRAVRAPFGPKT